MAPKKCATALFELEEVLELMSEKRAAAREKALGEMIEACRKGQLQGDLGNRIETVVESVVSCLKKGGRAEAIQACVCLQVGGFDLHFRRNTRRSVSPELNVAGMMQLIFISCHDAAAGAFDEILHSVGLQVSTPHEGKRTLYAVALQLELMSPTSERLGRSCAPTISTWLMFSKLTEASLLSWFRGQ